MLHITISDTGESKTLSIIDPKTGIDYIADFVGNHGALDNGDFTDDDGEGVYTCNRETFEWWSTVIADCQQLDERLHQLTNQHGIEAVMAALDGAVDCDLEYYAERANQALDSAFPED
jgi:hypothetical protein